MDINDVYSFAFDKSLVKGITGYNNFVSLQQEVLQAKQKTVSVNINWSGQLGRTYLFLIKCLLYLAHQHDKTLHITVSNKMYAYLNEMKFLEDDPHFDIEVEKKSLRFRRLNQDDHISISKDIVDNFPTELSPKLYADMVSRICEMFNDAREHSSASHVLGCRYSKQHKKYCFACYDTGIGLIENVKTYHSS